MEINQILQTKDGRIIGNAIIVAKNNDIYKAITDYGSEINMNVDEVHELFYVPSMCELESNGFEISEHKNFVKQ